MNWLYEIHQKLIEVVYLLKDLNANIKELNQYNRTRGGK